MAATCFAPIRGKRVRATRLDDCGAYPVPTTANSLVTSSGAITISYEFSYAAGDELEQKNADGVLCVNSKSCDQFKRILLTIDFCNVDPDMFVLLTGMPVEVDSTSGVDVGFRVREGVACNKFALELWTGIDGAAACPMTNEVQSLTEGGAGLTSFTLTATLPGYGALTTGSITASTTSAAIQTALEGIDSIDPGDVVVTGPAGASNGPWNVSFVGRYAGVDVAQMTSTPTGGTGTLTVATVQAGGQVVSGGAYGYLLLPLVNNGTLQNFSFQNGVTTFQVKGWTNSGTLWGFGPYNVVPNGAAGVPSALKVALTSLDHMLFRYTTVAPPAAVCGFQVMPAAPTPAA